MLTVVNQGEAIMGEAIVGKTPATTWTMRLFSNNVFPAAGHTEADYTEVVGGGYAPIPLNAALWVASFNAPSSMLYPEVTFAYTGSTNAPGTVYGYYITNAAGKLIMAERLPIPPQVPSAADVNSRTRFLPVFTIGSVSND